MARVLIVDDAELWHAEGRRLLERAGHGVSCHYIPEPREHTGDYLPEALADALTDAEVLLIDKDFGGGITSTRLICVIRREFPKLPVIRWSNGYDNAKRPYMTYLGVTCMGKPNRKNEVEFSQTFANALEEQRLILSGPMGIFAEIDESETVEHQRQTAAWRKRQLGEIANLAVLAERDFRSIRTHRGTDLPGTMRRNLGHCICDGYLMARDIAPHLGALQRLVADFEAAGDVDDHLRICAEFIKTGNLEELELVRSCY